MKMTMVGSELCNGRMTYDSKGKLYLNLGNELSP